MMAWLSMHTLPPMSATSRSSSKDQAVAATKRGDEPFLRG
jgi:hypothetical protein